MIFGVHSALGARRRRHAKLIERLKDPAMRARMRKDMLTPSTTWDNEWQEIPGPEAIIIGVVQNPKLLPLQGKTLADVAKLQNKDPMDALFDLLIEDQAYTECCGVRHVGRPTSSGLAAAVDFYMQRLFRRIARRPASGRNIRTARAYGTFPRILRKYVREERKLGLEDAIRKFSALPAQRMRLADRGVFKDWHVGRCRGVRSRDHQRRSNVRRSEPVFAGHGVRAGQRRIGD